MRGILGDIDGYEMVEITGQYALGFFDEYLKGEPSPLLDPNQKPAFSGISIKSRGYVEQPE